MTLEERLRAYAKKGELVHMSVAFRNGRFQAVLSTSSPANGYASGEDVDPVKAIEQAFDATPVKARRPSEKRKKEITVAVNDEEPEAEEQSSLPSNWTQP